MQSGVEGIVVFVANGAVATRSMVEWWSPASDDNFSGMVSVVDHRRNFAACTSPSVFKQRNVAEILKRHGETPQDAHKVPDPEAHLDSWVLRHDAPVFGLEHALRNRPTSFRPACEPSPPPTRPLAAPLSPRTPSPVPGDDVEDRPSVPPTASFKPPPAHLTHGERLKYIVDGAKGSTHPLRHTPQLPSHAHSPRARSRPSKPQGASRESNSLDASQSASPFARSVDYERLALVMTKSMASPTMLAALRGLAKGSSSSSSSSPSPSPSRSRRRGGAHPPRPVTERQRRRSRRAPDGRRDGGGAGSGDGTTASQLDPPSPPTVSSVQQPPRARDAAVPASRGGGSERRSGGGRSLGGGGHTVSAGGATLTDMPSSSGSRQYLPPERRSVSVQAVEQYSVSVQAPTVESEEAAVSPAKLALARLAHTLAARHMPAQQRGAPHPDYRTADPPDDSASWESGVSVEDPRRTGTAAHSPPLHTPVRDRNEPTDITAQNFGGRLGPVPAVRAYVPGASAARAPQERLAMEVLAPRVERAVRPSSSPLADHLRQQEWEKHQTPRADASPSSHRRSTAASRPDRSPRRGRSGSRHRSAAGPDSSHLDPAVSTAPRRRHPRASSSERAYVSRPDRKPQGEWASGSPSRSPAAGRPPASRERRQRSPSSSRRHKRPGSGNGARVSDDCAACGGRGGRASDLSPTRQSVVDLLPKERAVCTCGHSGGRVEQAVPRTLSSALGRPGGLRVVPDELTLADVPTGLPAYGDAADRLYDDPVDIRNLSPVGEVADDPDFQLERARNAAVRDAVLRTRMQRVSASPLRHGEAARKAESLVPHASTYGSASERPDRASVHSALTLTDLPSESATAVTSQSSRREGATRETSERTSRRSARSRGADASTGVALHSAASSAQHNRTAVSPSNALSFAGLTEDHSPSARSVPGYRPPTTSNALSSRDPPSSAYDTTIPQTVSASHRTTPHVSRATSSYGLTQQRSASPDDTSSQTSSTPDSAFASSTTQSQSAARSPSVQSSAPLSSISRTARNATLRPAYQVPRVQRPVGPSNSPYEVGSKPPPAWPQGVPYVGFPSRRKESPSRPPPAVAAGSNEDFEFSPDFQPLSVRVFLEARPHQAASESAAPSSCERVCRLGDRLDDLLSVAAAKTKFATPHPSALADAPPSRAVPAVLPGCVECDDDVMQSALAKWAATRERLVAKEAQHARDLHAWHLDTARALRSRAAAIEHALVATDAERAVRNASGHLRRAHERLMMDTLGADLSKSPRRHERTPDAARVTEPVPQSYRMAGARKSEALLSGVLAARDHATQRAAERSQRGPEFGSTRGGILYHDPARTPEPARFERMRARQEL